MSTCVLPAGHVHMHGLAAKLKIQMRCAQCVLWWDTRSGMARSRACVVYADSVAGELSWARQWQAAVAPGDGQRQVFGVEVLSQQ